MTSLGRGWAVCLAVAMLPALAAGQVPAPDAASLPEVEVIGTSPILGSGIDRNQVPVDTRSFSSGDLSSEGTPDLAGTLDRRVAGVTINGVADSSFQPDLQYRGFDASPVLGTPQGLAVYQNGVRINEAFGDTVNWDLVPDFAVNHVNLTSANPVFGLNALGGALALEMKTGFTYEGGEAEISGGSFGRRESIVQYGVRSGDFATYVGGRVLDESGWRQNSPSSIGQIYADIGAEGERATLHFSFSGGSNFISAVGPTPVQLLAQDWAAVFTSPQFTRDELAFPTLTGSYQASDTLRFDGNLYYRQFDQRVVNGNTTDAQACNPGPLAQTLCFGNGTTPLLDTAGQAIPNFLNGAAPGEIDRTSTNAAGTGFSFQATETAPLFGRGNHLVAGASLDHGSVGYSASSQIGSIASNLVVNGAGYTIDQPSGDLAPVSLNTTNDYVGLYATDTFEATDRLAITASFRENLAFIGLADQTGTALDGSHSYNRFDPAIGATWKLAPSVTAYGDYAETSRAPTPGELACADPTRPCLLDNFLVSDPQLKQVVARTWEGGLRGAWRPGPNEGRLTWTLDLYRTDTANDIVNLASPLSGFGYFQNVGGTRRQGFDAAAQYAVERWSFYADYGFIDATFQSGFTTNSPNNPYATGGVITVQPGDRLPSIPRNQLKLGGDFAPIAAVKLGADLILASSQYLRGDESNLNPQIPGYAVVDLDASWALTDHLELFGLVQNLFDQRYDTFGVFFDPAQAPGFGLTNPRSLSPAAPLGIFLGVRAKL